MKLTSLLPYLNQQSHETYKMMKEMGVELGQVVSDPRVNVFSPINEEGDDDKYTHIGYGKYKLKGKEDDKDSPTFTKDDSGKYIPTKDDEKGGKTPKPKVNIFDKPKSEPKSSEPKSKNTLKVSPSQVQKVMPKADSETFNQPSDINKIPDSQKMEVSMRIDKLAELSQQAKEKGEAAPNFNLCKITVPGTNLYCEGNAGIPREEMPQFKGTPEPGSRADKLPKDNSGEVDTEPMFKQMLKEKGIKTVETELPSDRLKATQSELVGAKVAGMTKALEKDPNHPGITAPIYVSRDGYVVDGHHRWAAMTSYAMKSGKPANMKVIVIDSDIKDVIPMANKFAEEIGVAPKKAQTQKEGRLTLKSILESKKRRITENEEDRGEVVVGGYKTQHFDICPGATSLYKDIENKVDDIDLATRTAKLQDVLFFIEKHVEEEGYKPNPYYSEVAQILGDQIMTMGGMMDLGSEHSYIQGHIDRIQSAVNDKSSVNEEKSMSELMKTANQFKKELTDLQRQYNKNKTKTLLMRIEAKKGQLLRVANAIRHARANRKESVNEANFKGKNWSFITFGDGDIRGFIDVSKTATWKLTNAGNSLGIGGQFTLMDGGKVRGKVPFPKAGNLAQLAKRMYDVAQKETSSGVDKNIKEKDILDGLRGYYKAWASAK